MKKLTILGIIACVGLLFALAATVDPPNGLDVNIVITLPVPVTGDVNATVTGDVNVGNEPVVKAQQEGEWSAKFQPPTIETVSKLSGFYEGDWGHAIYVVPEGYTLVIEYVGMEF